VAGLGGAMVLLGLVLVALHADVSEPVAIILIVGSLLIAWPTLVDQISKFSFGKDGISIELKDRLSAVESKAAGNQTAMATLARQTGGLIGSAAQQTTILNRVTALEAEALTEELSAVTPKLNVPRPGEIGASAADDPLAGKFGGQAVRGGRQLSASISRYGPVTDWASIEVQIEALPGAQPLTDPVILHLHPSFRPYDIQIVNPDSSGIAKLNLVSYGAFTIGAEVDRGATQLEFDLTKASGAFHPWVDR